MEDNQGVVNASENTVANFSENTYSDKMQQMRSVISSVVFGQEKTIDLLLTAVLAGGHVLIEGVPGVAKTLSARLIAKLIDAQFSRIQFTSDIMPSDVLGTNVFNMGTNAFELHKGPAFGDIILVDEINRAPAKTQSALFEVMEERQATIDGVCYPFGNIYTVFATQNPIEQEGTYRLPEAQMDRFMFKINVDYPSKYAELQVLMAHNVSSEYNKLANINPILTKDDVLSLREQAGKVFVDEKLMTYIVDLIAETRTDAMVYVAASPRASLSLLNAAKAYALIQGRNYVIPDDVKTLVYPVLCHRISLTAEAEMNGVAVSKVIAAIIDRVQVPK